MRKDKKIEVATGKEIYQVKDSKGFANFKNARFNP
jgi:hypothetical protein